MEDSLANELYEASNNGLLNSVDIEVVTAWIGKALALESEAKRNRFVKGMVLAQRAAIEERHSSFRAQDIVSHLDRMGRPSASTIECSLHSMMEDGTIACLDHGQPAVFAFAQKDS